MQVLGIKTQSTGLVWGAFSCRAVSPAPELNFYFLESRVSIYTPISRSTILISRCKKGLQRKSSGEGDSNRNREVATQEKDFPTSLL